MTTILHLHNNIYSCGIPTSNAMDEVHKYK